MRRPILKCHAHPLISQFQQFFISRQCCFAKSNGFCPEDAVDFRPEFANSLKLGHDLDLVVGTDFPGDPGPLGKIGRKWQLTIRQARVRELSEQDPLSAGCRNIDQNQIVIL